MDVVEALTRLGGVADTATPAAATSRRKVRTALARGEIVRVGRGHYALPTAQEAARAAARLSGVSSHLSAAAFWGWKTKRPPARPHVTVPRKRKVIAERRRGVHLHFADLTDEERRRGLTDPGRTVIDCAKHLPFDEALAVADSALRNGDLTRAELLELADQVPTSGRTECQRVAREADGRADNPFESVLRAISLDVDGLRLQPQQVIATRPHVIRPDLVDHRLRIVVEAESFEFHSDRAALARDCERYNELGVLGWVVYRFTWGHVMNAPWYVRQVLDAAVAARVVPGARTEAVRRAG